jgi:Uma2 family endonuclease
MTIITNSRMTIEEYLTYEDRTDTRYELVRGVLIEMPAESPLNILIARFLLLLFVQMGVPLDRVGNKQQIAVTSSEATVREPDLTVHSEASAAAILTQNQALLTLEMPAPLLVVEVVSPGEPGTPNYDRDYIEKPVEYAARGIQEYWIVDPSRQIIRVLTLKDDRYQQQQFTGEAKIISPAFPDFKLAVSQILKAGK